MAIRHGGRSPSRRSLGLQRRVPSKRFVPHGDSEFANLARHFAQQIRIDPARFAVSAEDSAQIEQAVTEFREALAKAKQRFTRSMQSTALKDEARAKAEHIIRKFHTLIRLNESIPVSDKMMLGITERSKPGRKKAELVTAPSLKFVRSTGDDRTCEPTHVLSFREAFVAGGRARPDGVARLELFVELVPLDAPIPIHPGQLNGGWGKYLRSYTRSPIRVEFPMADQPMRIVYWARWADSTGNVGPFCKTVVARVEGWDKVQPPLPRFPGLGKRSQRIVITSAMKQLPNCEQQIEDVSAGVMKLLAEATAALE